jgi:hypothetical protein
MEMEPLSQRFASASMAYSKREQSVRRNLGVAEVAEMGRAQVGGYRRRE